MAKLLITTQVYENYGTDGNDYWKPKGGNDYVLKNFKDFSNVTETVMALRNQIEGDNDRYYLEHIVDWCVVEDDYLTEFEKSQLEFDGCIVYPAKELSLGEMV